MNICIKGLAVWMLVLTVPAMAGAASAQETIPEAYVKTAEAFDVPANLLYSIAKTESNAGFSGRPWPWTLNVRGQPHYFQTRRQAVEFLEQEIAGGEDRIAIGLMQIYWKYHGNTLPSIELAIDPAYNLAYGAYYLRTLFDRYGDWAVATACYHHCDRRGAPEIGDAYVQLVDHRMRGLQQ